MSTRKPDHEIRLGLIEAAIWRNQGKHGDRYVTTFARLFKDGTEWRESTRFDRDDLLVLAKVADLANSFIFESQQQDS